MKILIISHMYPSSFNKVEGIFVKQQAEELKKQGYEVKVMSPVLWAPFPIKHLSKKWKGYSQVPLEIKENGIEVYYPRYLTFPKALFFTSSGKRMYWGIRGVVAKIYEDFKFDIIHSHVALPDGYAGMKIAKNYKKPLIVTIHGQDFQQTIYKSRKCQKIIKRVVNFSKKTIVVSDKLKNIGLNKLKINFQKLIVISNGINTEDIYVKESNLIERYRGKKIILSVSHLIKIKGIDLNIKAIARLIGKYSNIVYLIIGDGKQRKNLKNLAKNLNITNNVKFLSQLSHDKAMEYMSICDIFSLPSWNEAFGVVYIEAMAHGKPVVACKEEGIDGIIKHEETGLLEKPKDSDAIVKAIDFLLSNPRKAQKIGEKAKKLVLENYTWQKNAEKTSKIYKNVIKNYGRK
jgi:hypothetical protein